MKKKLAVFLLMSSLFGAAVAEEYTLLKPARQVVSQVHTYNWDSSKGWFVGQLSRKFVTNYGDKNHILSEELYYGDGKLAEKTTYLYQENSIVKTTVNSDGAVLRSATVIREDSQSKEIVLRSDGTTWFKTVAFLDEQGRVNKQEYYREGEYFIFYKIFTYNGAGNLEKIAIYNPDESFFLAITITYDSFDAMGNWLVRSEYYTYADVRSRPRDIITRTITY